jgi:hypothetical protein
MEISQDLGHRPVIFIRFNPDAYKDIAGKTITSCWAMNKQGITALKKCKVAEWATRLKGLSEQIQHWADHPTEKTVELIALFY